MNRAALTAGEIATFTEGLRLPAFMLNQTAMAMGIAALGVLLLVLTRGGGLLGNRSGLATRAELRKTLGARTVRKAAGELRPGGITAPPETTTAATPGGLRSFLRTGERS